LDEVLGGGAEVEARQRLGFEVAAGHTWEASAANHVSAYRWAAARQGSPPPGAEAGPR
jgi:hypothetical protein